MADREIGNAYVTVKPKVDKGFGDDLGRQMSGPVSGAGTQSGSKFGGAFSVAAGNIMSQAFMKIVEVATDTFIEGFNNYAEFEQLAGGVEKIFDQADQSRIFQDAANAYRDLNMSANQYLASINQVGATFAQTMGDQRGYDVARKGMKAISDYASGTGRNIDELSQKFTLITRSTSSYQSIADQFSGILPQTSADFLAQAQAAGLLSTEYTKLTEVPVAEYQEALTAMLERGVDQMGLAGNTAAETANTITGSLAGLSASWDNFLTALFTKDADLQPYLDALGESLMNAGENILRIMEALGENLLTVLSYGGQNLQAFLDELGANMGASVTSFVLSTRDSVVATWDQLVANLGAIWGNLQTMASDAFNGVLNTAISIWNGVKTAIETPINAARDAVSAAISAIRALFNFEFHWPLIPLPHFSISGSVNPLDWITQGVPQISVDWYARGGIVDGATLIGAGEQGPEAIVPLTAPNLKPFADAVADAMGRRGGDTFVFNVTADSETTLQRLVREANQMRRQYATA